MTLERLKVTHFLMVGAEYDPAAEAVAQVDHGGAAAKTDHVGKRSSKGDDQDLRHTHTHARSLHMILVHHGTVEVQTVLRCIS